LSQLLVHGGTVLTEDASGPVASAFLVEDGRVAATGTDEEMSAQARPGAERLDLGRRFACPGFIDVHNHFFFSVFAALGIDCRRPPVHSVEQLLSEIGQAVARTPKGQWVRGWGYNELDLGGRHPTRAELDHLAPEHPVVIEHASGHMCVANSLALDAAGITPSTPNPPNGLIVRHRSSGELTGVLHENASEMVDVAARNAIVAADPDGWLQAAREVARGYAALGLTTICDPCVPAAVQPQYDLLVGDPEFPIQLMGLGMGVRGKFASPADRLAEPVGDGGFAISGIKFFADGGEQCAMCMSKGAAVRGALRTVRNSIRHRTLMAARLFGAPVSRLGSDGNIHSGIKFYGDDELGDLLQQTAGRGLTAAVHAMGNEAIEQVLDAVEHARRGMAGDASFRMEHVMMPSERSLPRLAELGVAAVVQPRFVRDYGFPLLLTGLNREFRVLAFRDLLDAGVVVAGSSDAPVSDPAVLPAIEAAVTRRTEPGEVLDRDQAISVEETLAIYTTGSARVLGLDWDHGALRPGAVADFVVLDADPRAVKPSEIGAIEVDLTYRQGRRVYERAR
jgi:predicted amidohydrolase YtcJ